ncbi:MAG TPA: futalosine hydrolase [Bacteroidia bacterium]|nr:futalosine hydrolase [Bacteroidia bacterium]
MSKILIVAATEPEVDFLIKKSKKTINRHLKTVKGSTKHEIDLLITGPGITATAYQLTKALITKKYDLAINIGICGSFDAHLKPVRLVNIITDQFGDFGAENGDKNLDVFEIGLVKQNDPPFRNGKLTVKPLKQLKCLKAIRNAEAITVQRVHGSDQSIRKAHKKFGNVVESMEGAAFFYVCLKEKVACIQVRAISNMVEKRNKKNWKIRESVDALEGFTGLMLMELENSFG